MSKHSPLDNALVLFVLIAKSERAGCIMQVGYDV